MHTLENIAIKHFTAAKYAFLGDSHAASIAWFAVRKVNKRLRAPCWDEKLFHNSSNKRSYVSPLGQIIGIGYEYGSHSGKYRRTQKSYHAHSINTEKVISRIKELSISYQERLLHNPEELSEVMVLAEKYKISNKRIENV